MLAELSAVEMDVNVNPARRGDEAFRSPAQSSPRRR